MSVNKVPNNIFQQGLTVRGGITTDSLVVNGGVSITNSGSGSGVTVSTDINNNSETNVPSTSVTYALKQTNDNQTTQINTNTTTIAAIQTQLENLYGTSLASSWAGIGVSALASGATYLQKSGGTMTGALALGTNDIGSVRDVKFSNALLGGTTANVYCSNVVVASCLRNVQWQRVSADQPEPDNRERLWNSFSGDSYIGAGPPLQQGTWCFADK